jgi:hypothetical protein
MCTVSWFREDGGYQLLCNRDEKRTRAQAVGPSRTTAGAAQFLAPVDGQAGGTWLLTNEFGLSLCVLNGLALSGSMAWFGRGERLESRGLLLPRWSAARTAVEVCELVSKTELTSTAPFTLLIIEPEMPAMVVEWNGSEEFYLLDADAYMPLVSSSFDPDAVRAHRHREFERRLAGRPPGSDLLYSFHESHGGYPSPYSPCMHRPDAETVSFSCVKVTPRTAEFFYLPASPCQRVMGTTVTLGLRQ